MILRSKKADVQQEQPSSSKVDTSAMFQTPAEYKNGSRKRLKGFHSGDWWLNVDYVTAEVAA